MKNREWSRRDFVRTATSVVAPVLAGPKRPAPSWRVGCFNRAWADATFEQTLRGIREAGFETMGLISPQAGEPFIAAGATPGTLAGLKARIQAAGLELVIASIRFEQDAPLESILTDVRQQMENAALLGVKHVMTFGVDQPRNFDKFYRVMADAAAFGAKRGVQLVLKPHGGVATGATELLECLKRVGSPNFKIWYDAGNIVYYSDKDPVAELERIAPHVTGICAKDCDRRKGEVMLQFGAGRVDFKAVFRALGASGFDGPVLVEGLQVGTTLAETGANARSNRKFLLEVIARTLKERRTE